MLLFALLVGGGVAFASFVWLGRQPAGENAKVPPVVTSDPPAPVYASNEEGVRRASVNAELLSAWCAAAGLPAPPVLDSAEPIVADTLIEALRNAARRPGAETFGRLGRISEHVKSHDSAIEYFKRAASADPGDFRWVYHLGCVFQITGQADEAIAAFEQVLDLNAAYEVTHARLGQLKLETNRDEEAAVHFRRYAELRPRDSLGHVGLGRLAIRRGDFETALNHLQEAMKWGANDFQCHYNLGRAYAGLGFEEPAKKHFAICKELPKGAWFKFRDPLAQELHASTGSISLAIAEFERLKNSEDWPRLAVLGERILLQRPADTALLRNLALIYAKLTRFDEAEEVIRRAIELQPSDERLHFALARVLFFAQDHKSALTAIENVLNLNPNDAAAHSIRSRCLFVVGRHGEAVTAMKRALELKPDSVESLYLLAEMLRQSGREPEAISYYERALELEPRYTPARERLRELGQVD